MSSLDPIISADLVRTRAELAALTADLSSARNVINWIGDVLGVTRSELAAARNEIAAGAASSPIRSVQRGVTLLIPTANPGITGYTVYVAAVNPAKCMLNITGMNGLRYNPEVPFPAHAQLTSATTIQLTLGTNLISGYGSYFYMAWELLEFK